MANNQEYRRMTSSSEMDERTAREIYLAAFEGMVKHGKPWTIMNSYNRLNGTCLCENKEILTDVLRKDWGFDGYVMTDWGAMNCRADALKAGCNLEMPGGSCITDGQIVKAVKDGELDEEILNKSCEELLNIVFRYAENRDENAVFDRDKDHEAARELEQECIVLLKNEDGILPLSREKKIAIIGKYAKMPRYQGGGSSHINSSKVDCALDSISSWAEVVYARGYEDGEDVTDENMLQEAVEAAKQSEAAVIFAGLPDSFESEGYDRTHLHMPDCQNRLIEEVGKVQPNTVVVLHNGAPVEMPWLSQVKGVVEAYLGGQAVGSAVANVLYGKVNPSGRLLLYPTLNMAGVEDEYFKPGMENFEMAPKQKRGLTKMLEMFGGMTAGLEPILGTKDVNNDYLNPYTRDAKNNPPTFLTVGEHDFLKIETLGYGAKLHKVGVETKMVLYKGFGHAFFDNTGVYPQCEDCIDEMGIFMCSDIRGLISPLILPDQDVRNKVLG